MTPTRAQTPFLLFKYAILVCVFFTFLSWLLLLGGISAIEDICPGRCRIPGQGSVTGLPWFIIWFQFILVIPAFVVEFADRFTAWRSTLNILLAINTVLAIIETDKFLSWKDSRVVPFVNATSRFNASIAGFIILSIFNLLLIILSGSRTALKARYGEDRDVGVATYPSKTRPTTPAGPAAPQVTVTQSRRLVEVT